MDARLKAVGFDEAQRQRIMVDYAGYVDRFTTVATSQVMEWQDVVRWFRDALINLPSRRIEAQANHPLTPLPAVGESGIDQELFRTWVQENQTAREATSAETDADSITPEVAAQLDSICAAWVAQWWPHAKAFALTAARESNSFMYLVTDAKAQLAALSFERDELNRRVFRELRAAIANELGAEVADKLPALPEGKGKGSGAAIGAMTPNFSFTTSPAGDAAP